MRFPDELKEMLLEPAKEAIAHLELHRELLCWDELETLEKLKFSIRMFELEKQYKQKRGF